MSASGEVIRLAIDNCAAQLAADVAFVDPWERYVTPAFPFDLLPLAVRAFVAQQAEAMGGDPSSLAMAALTACSGALSHDVRMKMTRNGDFFVRPRLWTLLVGEPSTRKTPIMRAAVDPLDELDGAAVAAHDLASSLWRNNEKKGDEPRRPARHVVRDTTPEKMAEILARSPRGAMHFRDEIAGFVGSMEKYGSGRSSAADRAFWLKTYDGGRYTMDRVNGGERSVLNLSISFLGGIQPDRLSELGNLTSDGLLQRFIPVMMRRPSLPAETADDQPDSGYADLIRDLAAEPSAVILCDGGALAVTRRVMEWLHELEQSDAFGKGLTGFVGKLLGAYGSLTLLLHMLDAPSARAAQVTEGTALRAEAIIRRFVLPHAAEFYRAADERSDGEDLRLVASYILTATLTRFRPSDFTANVRALRGLGEWDLSKKLSPLVTGGWILPEGDGPITRAWSINPSLRDRFAQRAESERARRDRVRSHLQSLQDRS